MLGNRTSEEWIAEYATAHTHPVNRVCHTIGIPMIAVSLVLALAAPFVFGLWRWALLLFVAGWVFQFVGHSYEKKPPEFLKDWQCRVPCPAFCSPIKMKTAPVQLELPTWGRRSRRRRSGYPPPLRAPTPTPVESPSARSIASVAMRGNLDTCASRAYLGPAGPGKETGEARFQC